jgi:hypothetical protein
LYGVTFSGFARLLLSATHLVSLYLNLAEDPRVAGRVSPEAMVTVLPALTRLERLCFGSMFYPFGASFDVDDGRLSPSTRSVLPALTRLTFRGSGKDLMILVAQLDAPLLNRLSVTFFDTIYFYTPQLARFIGHAPRFSANDEASIVVYDCAVTFKFASRAIGHELEGPIQSTESVSTLAHIR